MSMTEARTRPGAVSDDESENISKAGWKSDDGLRTRRLPFAAVRTVAPVTTLPLIASASSLSAVIAPALMWLASIEPAAIFVAVTALTGSCRW
ncbi:hypothetical protein JIX56_41390 [Streptomyces sp. CA-210063]|uniref:hypothetical protein n=1 Tax=Streptomyces sp. CA-210063 TaxID=2801029 RepID=UPI00214CEAFB|nr:hypothetical protein [Streptomyces sp. CA-210063]UUU35790.1 hypothetical protein JIX56_41390 [Streptomyces sp. CA-210063]